MLQAMNAVSLNTKTDSENVGPSGPMPANSGGYVSDITSRDIEQARQFGIGTPEYVGMVIHVLRAGYRRTIADWASMIGKDKSTLSRIEAGKGNVPQRKELIEWAGKWKLTSTERDDLLLSAAMLPYLEGISELNDEERKVFNSAVRELVQPDMTSVFGPLWKQKFSGFILRLGSQKPEHGMP